jgi:hypothetical protein
MAGIGAWIAAMENWRTAVLEKPMKATKDLKILGWMLHWIASSWAILRACCKEVKGSLLLWRCPRVSRNPYHFAVESDTVLLLQLKSLWRPE